MLNKCRFWMLSFAVLFAGGISVDAMAKKKRKKRKKRKKKAMMSKGGYGTAGCGLGSIIFGAKPGFMQVFSATTNGFWGTQTFGITSGTSNCDIPRMGMAAATFIEMNRELVSKEGARGQGESISGLASIFRCNDASYFGQKIKQNYVDVFGSEDAYESSRQITNIIRADRQLTESCSPSLTKG